MSNSFASSDPVTLVAEHRGRRIVCPLEDGNGVLIGSSSTCGLHLDADDVAGFHCHVSLDDGIIWVQDWQSDVGTLVNDQRIEDRVKLQAGDQLGVGPYRFTVNAGSRGDARSPISPGAKSETAPVNSDPVVEPETGNTESVEEVPRVIDDAAMLPSNESSEPQAAAMSTDGQPDSEPAAVSPSLQEVTMEDDDALALFDDSWMEDDSFDAETVALLQAEVEDLQSQLAERDARLAGMEAQLQEAAQPTDPQMGENSESLIARIDQLLDEAEKSDERSRMLEELLHAADVATRAEQEERANLEAWVGDIERRISQREAEFAGEVEILRSRLADVTEQRDRAVLHMQSKVAADTSSVEAEETIKELQQQLKTLEEQVTTLQTERANLQQRLEGIENRQDESMREERALLAKERAKVSRLRFELSRQLAELEEAPESSNPEDREVAIRIKTLREHLREIHSQEQVEEQAAREASLTGRITRLWKRVDN